MVIHGWLSAIAPLRLVCIRKWYWIVHFKQRHCASVHLGCHIQLKWICPNVVPLTKVGT